MMGLIGIILFWIATVAISIRFGTEIIANDLLKVNRINQSEFNNFISWDYIISKIKDDIRD